MENMRITIEQLGINDKYVRVTFHHNNVDVRTELLTWDECTVLAERLRSAAESIEHYSRVIQPKEQELVV